MLTQVETDQIDKYRALKKDYQKLLVQVQAELVQKEYYKKQYSMMLSLISIKDIKISRLEMLVTESAKEL
jgi:hypothetical protein